MQGCLNDIRGAEDNMRSLLYFRHRKGIRVVPCSLEDVTVCTFEGDVARGYTGAPVKSELCQPRVCFSRLP
jgi:hypothetical protein